MFENIINLVEEHAGAAINNNPEIPDQHNAAITGEASNSIIDGLKNAIAGGNTEDVTNLLNGNHTVADSPVAQNIQGNFISTIMNKFGLSESAATGAASSLIPAVLGKMVSGSGGAGGFDLNGLLSKLTGGGNTNLSSTAQPNQGGGLADELKNLL